MKWGLVVLGLLVGAGGMYLGLNYRMYFRKDMANSVVNREKPLEKYTIENLGKREYKSQIVMDDIVSTQSAFFVQKFHFDADGKRVNGLAHLPAGRQTCSEENKCPVIVQIRGYAEVENYYSGYGTARSAVKYAGAGFISLAPDFLGYNGSDAPSSDIYEARFETYSTALNLLAGISSLPMASADKVGIWGHSNGGQIALTVLEISQKAYPTTLWAPVSAPFPYSVLFYTDDSPDHGKEMRRVLARFEEDYDVEQYALVNYLDRIAAPLQIHQGTADDSVPVKWTDTLVKNLKTLKKDVTYYKYPGADHNMLPDAWNSVVERDIEFFRREMGKID